jgi:septal ring factor EnvC (AmiA/AmiB activator)
LKNELYISTNEEDKPASDSNSESIEAERSEIESNLNAIKDSIIKVESRYNSIKSDIELVLKPLERTARKYDHSSSSKTSLASIISSPISKIGNELSYASFIAMLKDMGTKVSDGSIKIENSAQILEQINDAVNAGIDSAIAEANSSMKQKAELEHQEKDYDNKLYETRKKATTIESERRSRMSNLEHQTEIKMQIENAKATIEKMFMQYYNVKVHITD